MTSAMTSAFLQGLRDRGFLVSVFDGHVNVHPECMLKPSDIETIAASHDEMLASLVASDEAKGEDRPLWVLMPVGHRPAAVPVDSLADAPAEATHWVRMGDEVWKPLATRGRGGRANVESAPSRQLVSSNREKENSHGSR